MKKLIVLILFMFLATTSYAAVYVIVDDATSEIVSVSPEDDAVLIAGQTKVVRPNLVYSEIILNHNPQDYKYINGKFVENIQKISDQENARISSEEKQAEKLLIKLLLSENHEEIKNALEALSEIGGIDSLEAVEKLTESSDENIQKYAKIALKNIRKRLEK